ncbi:peptidoglycan recognition protein family protein [Mesorhizobium sp. NBSH29]|uniref:peptidoglycan recognition protein family protein n=1 Tax=Mesorhizobium sp. NBSH29 TaxID=2654249 RepID=UPI001AEF2976|nr:peptidoglycan recognition family protein [Mesorhizobium sp. NBSH29]
MALPSDWMPDVPMKRVVFHWTAGAHSAGSTDRDAYHVLVEGNGRVVRGNPSIALNSGRVKKGYAAHTLNCNGGAIGVSMCCMGGARENPLDAGRYPLTQAQWDMLALVIAELCKFYRIPVSSRTVLSHAEVEPNLGIRQEGKWDVSCLPFDPSCRGARACGDRMRAQVQAAMGSMPQLPVRKGKDPSPLQALLEEIVPILVRGLQAGLNTLIREIVKRIT